MLHKTPVFGQTVQATGFPILDLKHVQKIREGHRILLKKIFPKAVRLRRLILNIEKNFTDEVASIIGSVDFAQERLSGLIAALKELEMQVSTANYVELEEVREQIRQDHRIHESLEDLVFDCVKFTLDES